MDKSVPAEIYSRDYYLAFCDGHQEFLSGSVAPRLQSAIRSGHLQDGLRVLDIGCGRGELLVMCALAGCNVWGVDYSADAVEIASKYFRAHVPAESMGRNRIQRMNAQALAFPDSSFDRVFMMDVVEHLYPPELNEALQEVRRVTKPGGKVVIHTAPNAWLIKPAYLVAGIFFGWQKQPHHVNEQSYFSLQRSLRCFKGKTSIWIEKLPGFFTNGVGDKARGRSREGQVAHLLDRFLDHPTVTRLVSGSALRLLLGTNLWAVVDLPADRTEAGA